MFLYKRSNGIYYLCYKDDSGKRAFISTKEKKKTDALKFLTNFKNKPNPSGDKIKLIYLSELRNEVMKYVTANLGFKTADAYKNTFNQLLHIIGDKPIKLITSAEIEHYKVTRAEAIAKSTANMDLIRVGAIFNIAIRFQWLESNPVKNVKRFKIPQKEIIAIPDNEIELILNNTEHPKLKNFILFGLMTGCRRNEIVNIQWKDIDLRERILTIRNKPNFVTKTGRIRLIPISDSLESLIKKMQNNEGNILSFRNPESYVFDNGKGYKYSVAYMGNVFKNTIKKLNLDSRYSMHSLRRTFITKLIKSGVPINYVKELAGHSDIKTTTAYVSVTTNDLRNAVNKINL
ncbi:MAG: site-specific integrase [Bacteroidetes bacterium]|nr:site-specific integrase [Bacteroidota bacterium]